MQISLIKINQLESDCYELALKIARKKVKLLPHHEDEANLKTMLTHMGNLTRSFCGTIEKPNYETLAEQKKRLLLNQ